MGKIKKKDIKLIIFAVVGAIVVFLVVWLVYNMFTPKVTNISTERRQTEYSAIKCTATAPEGALFKAQKGASTQTQTIKMTFQDNKVDKIAYEYEGEYSGEEAAEQASTNLHIAYNEYMGADAESLSPAFAAVKTTARVNLLVRREKLNSKNAKVFFLNTDEVADIGNYEPEKIEKIYEARGFSCKIDK